MRKLPLLGGSKKLIFTSGQSQMLFGLFSAHRGFGFELFDRLIAKFIRPHTIEMKSVAVNGAPVTTTASASKGHVDTSDWNNLADGPTLTQAASTITTQITNEGVSLSDVVAVFISIGRADTEALVAGDMTREQYVSACDYYVSRLKAIIGSHVKIIVFPDAWTSSDLNAATEDEQQFVRETWQEITGADLWGEFYHVGMDASAGYHHDAAGTEALCMMIIYQTLFLLGYRSENLAACPYVASATLSGSRITATITHENGTDMTFPAGAELYFSIKDDTGRLTINDIGRLSATSFYIDVDETPSGTVQLLVAPYDMWGRQADGSDCPVDNSPLGLPLRSDVITVS